MNIGFIDHTDRFDDKNGRLLKISLYASAPIPTKYGEFLVNVYHNNRDKKEHLAIVKGEVRRENVPVRIHSECLTSEVLGSLKCDCKEQLDWACNHIARQGFGVVVYLRQEGRGIGLGNKIRAYALQDAGLDTVEANHHLGFPNDLRTYDVAAKILEHLGVKSVDLITNNPEKIEGLSSQNTIISRRIPVIMEPNPHNLFYLETKQEKSGHLLETSKKNIDN
ncbi:MAG: GTP cyclohydrolase II [Candidatus Cloacimonetes bacterium 4572_55]|nr:MAG: GTP cyclohydrolase II [Candidatus Cloacimonetes bacterium 4572_55]